MLTSLCASLWNILQKVNGSFLSWGFFHLSCILNGLLFFFLLELYKPKTITLGLNSQINDMKSQ